ncbi:MAG: aminopeptidase P family protein [Clostridiales bacterium]|nr:aminopeptidase P family protein [Clostridiales bacterium]
MENQVIKTRLKAFRERMKEAGIDYYMVPTADFHHSEYVSDYFKAREFLCGFSGSNGTLVVGENWAGLWTDGRYFIQAAAELEGTGVTLFRMLDEGVPTIEEYLEQNMPEGAVLGFDGRVLEMARGKRLEEKLAWKGIRFSYETDLTDLIWKERPDFPCGQVSVLPKDFVGKSITEKLSQVRQQFTKNGAAALFLSKLDDIMWLFNIRGCDVECNPVALSYSYITEQKAVLFLQKGAVTEELLNYFTDYGVEVKEYDSVFRVLEQVGEGIKIQLDPANSSYAVYKTLERKAELIEKSNPTELLKAVKNETELAHMREVYKRDSAAVCKFIYWLKKNIVTQELTEVSAAEHLDGLRREIDGFLDLSFPTISGYAENAAMMHYEATKECHKVLKSEGMLLVDSGGQYLGGTTDVTRTIVLGKINDEIRRHYTAVVSGMLQLSAASFLHGCTGRNLDILARQPLWDLNIDYKCGTGHGIGYILNVHEGPHNIRWRFADGMKEAVLEAGMVVTNEPGVYIEGSHGIRIENVLVAVNGKKNEDGQFMHFETLTFVPIDLDGIEPSCMTEENKKRLNAYHRQVREIMTPYLDQEEAEWLAQVTRPV